MAVAVSTTYNQNGLAEDFENVVFNITPTETPLLTMASRKDANARLHQWQEDSLAAAAANAQIEGDDAAFTTAVPTVTLGNYCQIFRKTAQVSGTMQAVKKYGRNDEMAFLMKKAAQELKRDIEYALVRNGAATAGTQASARTMAGLETWINSQDGNTVKSSTNTAHTTATLTGTVPATAPTDGTATTFNEPDLKTMLQYIWTDGGDARVIMLSPTNKNRMDNFAGIATKYNEVKGNQQATIIGAADMYVSSYGNHTVVLNRYMRDQPVFGIDPDYVSVAWLRPIQQMDVASTGDSKKKMILGECTLVVGNRNAHGKVASVGS